MQVTRLCQQLSQRQKVTGILIVTVVALLTLYYAYSRRVFTYDFADPTDEDSPDHSDTVVSRQQVLRWNDSALLNCPVYREFRETNFSHPMVAKTVCKGGRGYRKIDGKYGPCILRQPFNPCLLRQALEASRRTYFHGLKGERLPALVLALGDSASKYFLKDHEWELALVKKLAAIVKAFPSTTFIDIGSNLGPYTIPMAAHGIPTISMDANFRVIIRVLLTLMANGIKPDQSQLLWNIVSKNDTELEYLTFPGACDTFVGRKTKIGLKDTIPVMPMASKHLAPLIRTKNVVLKIDVDGSEAGFFLTSGSLFKDFNFIAVQMEWVADLQGAANMRSIIEFFTSRNYVPFMAYTWAELAVGKYSVWHKTHGYSFEILWVRGELNRQVFNTRL